MKKKIFAGILISLLLFGCACAQKTENEGTKESAAEETAADEENPYAGINELEPVDGVYKIHSLVGVQNIANHLDAEFEVLCDIDLEGAVLTPIGTEEAPFTGYINGMQYYISNFSIEGAEGEENLGFLGVNEGRVLNLFLTDMTVTANESSRYIGGLCGYNKGTLLRCQASGSLNVAQAAEGACCGGAVGYNEAELNNSVFAVDVVYEAKGTASVGGLVGVQDGGVLLDTSTDGAIDVSSADGKTMGLFAGQAKNVEAKQLIFRGGSTTLGGRTYTEFFGQTENASVTEWLLRDNSMATLSEDEAAVRQKVVDAMYAMGSVAWQVPVPVEYDCTCSLGICHGTFMPGVQYYGLPYNHKGGGLTRFLYCMDEDGMLKDWICEAGSYDGYDMYLGNDCSTAVAQAWATVSTDCDIIRTSLMHPQYENGTIAVGDWVTDLGEDNTIYTDAYVEATGLEKLYECYMQLHPGDVVTNTIKSGGHARMVAAEPVIVRDEEGNLDPDASYLITHEQGTITETDTSYTTWKLNGHYSFSTLAGDSYVPVTIKELKEGKTDEPWVKLSDDAEGKAGLTTGIVTSNYNMDSLRMVLTDEEGTLVFDHTLFPSVDKMWDAYTNDLVIRRMINEYDLAHFATPLQAMNFEQGVAYHCVITVHLSSGEDVVVKDFSF